MEIAWRILLILLAIASAESVSAFVAPYPVAETEKVISLWLNESGFEILKQRSDGGVMIEASSKDRLWKLRLRPHSPLATEVEAEGKINGSADQGASDRIEKHILSYNTARPSGVDLPFGVPNAVAAHEGAVVCIKADNKGRPIQFTGFFINHKSQIIGTAHDLGEIRKVRIRMPDGQETAGRVLRVDKRADLSLIESDTHPVSYISFEGSRALVEFGEAVYAIGCPLEKSGIVTPGVIKGPLRLSESMPLWQAEMKTLPGGSGSPVFDAHGSFVGVVRGRYKGDDSQGFIIPVGTVNKFTGKK